MSPIAIFALILVIGTSLGIAVGSFVIRQRRRDVPHIGRPVIVRAFQPGDLLVIETDRPLSPDDANRLRSAIEPLTKAAVRIKILVLESGMRVVAKEAHDELLIALRSICYHNHPAALEDGASVVWRADCPACNPQHTAAAAIAKVAKS